MEHISRIDALPDLVRPARAESAFAVDAMGGVAVSTGASGLRVPLSSTLPCDIPAGLSIDKVF